MVSGRRVAVTGGGSFIGSHLCQALLEAGAVVRVIDDFSSGSITNLRDVADDVEVLRLDLRSPDAGYAACAGAEVVFHLAAIHGGRGFIDSHPAACAENMLLDQHVFRGALRAGVGKLVFASSACVYPSSLQVSGSAFRPLREELVGPPYEPDGLYGMAKLCGELLLRELVREHAVSAATCRYFTVYGPRCGESHALMAMLARAFARTDPMEVWGSGDQVRTWVYVDDVVRMTLLAAERIDDGSAVNVATDERRTVREAAELVLQAAAHDVPIRVRPDMPTGPAYRVADVGRAKEVLGYTAQVQLPDGVRRTAEWYFATKDRTAVAATLDRLLVDRHA